MSYVWFLIFHLPTIFHLYLHLTFVFFIDETLEPTNFPIFMTAKLKLSTTAILRATLTPIFSAWGGLVDEKLLTHSTVRFCLSKVSCSSLNHPDGDLNTTENPYQNSVGDEPFSWFWSTVAISHRTPGTEGVGAPPIIGGPCSSCSTAWNRRWIISSISTHRTRSRKLDDCCACEFTHLSTSDIIMICASIVERCDAFHPTRPAVMLDDLEQPALRANTLEPNSPRS